MRPKQTINPWLLAYGILAAVELAGEISGNRTLVYASKPFLMPVLAAWLVRTTDLSRGFLRREMVTGLIFAAVGDTLLMFSNVAPLFFLLGIGAFLFTQLFYAGGFLTVARFNRGLLARQWWWALPFVLYLVALLYIIWPYTDVGLRKPVALYGLALTGMALSIVNLRGTVSDALFWRFLAGGILFLISDTLIALYRFMSVFSGANVAIMITYILAQYLLASGARTLLLRRQEQRKSNKPAKA